MKITEALCKWIESAGGSPTAKDESSITHAMSTLYTALGGSEPTDETDIASMVEDISEVASGGGGGGGSLKTIKVRVVNNRSTAASTDGNITCDIFKSVDGNPAFVQDTNRVAPQGGSRDYEDVMLFEGDEYVPYYLLFGIKNSKGKTCTINGSSAEDNSANVDSWSGTGTGYTFGKLMMVQYSIEPTADEVFTFTVT